MAMLKPDTQRREALAKVRANLEEFQNFKLYLTKEVDRRNETTVLEWPMVQDALGRKFIYRHSLEDKADTRAIFRRAVGLMMGGETEDEADWIGAHVDGLGRIDDKVSRLSGLYYQNDLNNHHFGEVIFHQLKRGETFILSTTQNQSLVDVYGDAPLSTFEMTAENINRAQQYNCPVWASLCIEAQDDLNRACFLPMSTMAVVGAETHMPIIVNASIMLDDIPGSYPARIMVPSEGDFLPVDACLIYDKGEIITASDVFDLLSRYIDF